ncbi:hypothetical protein [Bacillus mycoides]|uniref:hypothetical protein n=1 Tax=Bacillus mycoides TaxID=1405 RepID=UPI0021117CE8|nr:hypothetical protein [Bacillus mycoides]MCQ6530494.1 hypothetical protein [Bacillus mycoides]
MSILRGKPTCVAIGANIIFCIDLYIYIAYYNDFIYLDSGNLYRSLGDDITYILYALLVPLGGSIIFSYIAFGKKEDSKGILIFNLCFSIFFITPIGIWFVCLLNFL